MHIACTVGLAAAMLSGCAGAQPEPPARAAIADTEPEVTQQVRAVLAHTVQGTLDADPLTVNARAALTPERTSQLAAALRPCGEFDKMELLERRTMGEERQYLYRAPCGSQVLLVEIYFGKGARISHLNVRPQ